MFFASFLQCNKTFGVSLTHPHRLSVGLSSLPLALEGTVEPESLQFSPSPLPPSSSPPASPEVEDFVLRREKFANGSTIPESGVHSNGSLGGHMWPLIRQRDKIALPTQLSSLWVVISAWLRPLARWAPFGLLRCCRRRSPHGGVCYTSLLPHLIPRPLASQENCYCSWLQQWRDGL